MEIAWATTPNSMRSSPWMNAVAIGAHLEDFFEPVLQPFPLHGLLVDAQRTVRQHLDYNNLRSGHRS